MLEITTALAFSCYPNSRVTAFKDKVNHRMMFPAQIGAFYDSIGEMGSGQTGTNNSNNSSISSGIDERGQCSSLYVKSVEYTITVEGKNMVVEPWSQFKQAGGRSSYQHWPGGSEMSS
jgi:hypothetical protein